MISFLINGTYDILQDNEIDHNTNILLKKR